jgi:hypothetical protein
MSLFDLFFNLFFTLFFIRFWVTRRSFMLVLMNELGMFFQYMVDFVSCSHANSHSQHSVILLLMFDFSYVHNIACIKKKFFFSFLFSTY